MSHHRKRTASHALSDEEHETPHTQKKRGDALEITFRKCAWCTDYHQIIDYPILQGCTHVQDVCGTCYSRWLANLVSSKRVDHIVCPSPDCPVHLTDEDMKLYALPQVYERYDHLRTACTSAQINKSSINDEIFCCNNVGMMPCNLLKERFHRGQKCHLYEMRDSLEDETNARVAGAGHGHDESQCPGCGSDIYANSESSRARIICKS